MDLTRVRRGDRRRRTGHDRRAGDARRTGRRGATGDGTGRDRLDPSRRDDGAAAAPGRRSPSSTMRWRRTVSASRSRRRERSAERSPSGRAASAGSGYGPVRDVLLQARYVSAAGEIVKAGGPTVKNVSGFDLCRLLVGSRGTLGFLGDVIMRTRPRAAFEQWFTTHRRSVGDRARALPTDVACSGTARRRGCCSRAIPAMSPTRRSRPRWTAAIRRASCRSGGRWSMRPADLASLPGTGRFVAEIGVGIVHHELPAPVRVPTTPSSSCTAGSRSSSTRPVA